MSRYILKMPIGNEHHICNINLQVKNLMQFTPQKKFLILHPDTAIWFLVWNSPSDAMVARQTSERPRFCKFRESSSLKMLSSTDNNLLSSKQSFKIQLYASWWCWISSLFIRLFCFFPGEMKTSENPWFSGRRKTCRAWSCTELTKCKNIHYCDSAKSRKV